MSLCDADCAVNRLREPVVTPELLAKHCPNAIHIFLALNTLTAASEVAQGQKTPDVDQAQTALTSLLTSYASCTLSKHILARFKTPPLV